MVLIKSVEARSILSKSNLPVGDYSANPYVGCTHACKYCYASFMKRFTGHSEEWGAFLDVKNWPALKKVEKYAGREILIGSVTDPYLPQEEHYGRTRLLLEQLQGSGAKLSLITKSDLVERDLDLLSTFPGVTVAWSINTLQEDFRADMDCAASIERRLKAMEHFHKAGLRTVCFISPIFPGITEVEEIISRVRGICVEVWLENLNLRGHSRGVILAYIRRKYPHLVSLYREIYGRGDKTYWVDLDLSLAQWAARQGLTYVTKRTNWQGQTQEGSPTIFNYFYHELIKKCGIRN